MQSLSLISHLIVPILMLAYYLKARRAFRALKGIIRLQALIRGHLVRRQAISTLRCMLGIVKFQAIVRGVRFRSSNNLKGHETFRPVNPLVKFLPFL